MKLTKHDLMQFKYLESEIDMWKEELEICRYDLSLSSPNLTEGKGGGYFSDKTGRTAAKIADIKQTISDKLFELQIQKELIINYINSVEDSLMRQLLNMRYIRGLSWNTIAIETGCYNSPDNLRITLDNYLKKNCV